jgi:hypothetical protein
MQFLIRKLISMGTFDRKEAEPFGSGPARDPFEVYLGVTMAFASAGHPARALLLFS